MRKLLKKFSSAGRSKHTRDEKKDRIHVAVIPVVKSEAPDEDIPYVPPRASLEGLPVEIQSAVLLNICDIASLQSLVHASPIFHSVYIRQRQAILERVLFNSIHPDVLYDAFSAIASRTTLTGNVEYRVSRVKAFLLEYKDDRDTWTSPEHLGSGKCIEAGSATKSSTTRDRGPLPTSLFVSSIYRQPGGNP